MHSVQKCFVRKCCIGDLSISLSTTPPKIAHMAVKPSFRKVNVKIEICCCFDIVTCLSLYNRQLTAPSIASRNTSTSGSITFECSRHNTFMSYYGQVLELDTKHYLPSFNCGMNSCQCNAAGLKPNKGYLVSIKACIRTNPKVCSGDSNVEQIYTKPERKFTCSETQTVVTAKQFVPFVEPLTYDWYIGHPKPLNSFV